MAAWGQTLRAAVLSVVLTTAAGYNSPIHTWPLDAKNGGYEIIKQVDAVSPTLNNVFTVSPSPPPPLKKDPLWFNGSSKIDFAFSETKEYTKFTFSLFIYPESLSGTFFHYLAPASPDYVTQVKLWGMGNGSVAANVLVETAGSQHNISLSGGCRAAAGHEGSVQVACGRGDTAVALAVDGHVVDQRLFSPVVFIREIQNSIVISFGGEMAGGDYFLGKLTCANFQDDEAQLPDDLDMAEFQNSCEADRAETAPVTVQRSMLPATTAVAITTSNAVTTSVTTATVTTIKGAVTTTATTATTSSTTSAATTVKATTFTPTSGAVTSVGTSSDPATTVNTSASPADAVQAMAHLFVLDRGRGGRDLVAGQDASYSDDLCPRYGASYSTLDPAVRFDGSCQSLYEASLNNSILQGEFTLAFFLLPSSSDPGTILHWTNARSTSGIQRLRLLWTGSGVNLTVWDNQARQCGTVQVAGLAKDSWLHLVAERDLNSEVIYLAVGNSSTALASDMCPGNASSEPATTQFVIGGEGFGTANVRASLQCLAVFSRAVGNHVTPEMLRAWCESPAFNENAPSCVHAKTGEITRKGLRYSAIPDISVWPPISSLVTSTALQCAAACHRQPYCRSYVIAALHPGHVNCHILDYVDLHGSARPGHAYYVIRPN